MKMDQIAFACPTEEAEERVKAMLGLTEKEWIRDTVRGTVTVSHRAPGMYDSVAELQFNYDLGIEVELLRYTDGPNWLERHPAHRHSLGDSPFISHIGIHLAAGEGFPWPGYHTETTHDYPPLPAGTELVQEMWTASHTNPYLIEQKRLYHYRIYQLGSGAYIKYIKRVQA